MDQLLVGDEYANQLTDADLRLLASVAGSPAGGGPPGGAVAGTAQLRQDPSLLPALLSDPRTFTAVLGSHEKPAADIPVSPFLVFAAAVHRAASELAGAGYVPERAGLRQLVPLFDAPVLADFLDDAGRRLFLAELLASFTRVASGRYRVQSGGRVATRRFSELDPVRLAGLLDAVPAAERPGVYRRLGDVALFLAGVFPDYAASHALGPVDMARLLRATGTSGAQAERLAATPPIDLLEHLGARWYRAASELAAVRTARLRLVAEVAGRFRQARRVLNHVADRYLFPAGVPWLPRPGT